MTNYINTVHPVLLGAKGRQKPLVLTSAYTSSGWCSMLCPWWALSSQLPLANVHLSSTCTSQQLFLHLPHPREWHFHLPVAGPNLGILLAISLSSLPPAGPLSFLSSPLPAPRRALKIYSESNRLLPAPPPALGQPRGLGPGLYSSLLPALPAAAPAAAGRILTPPLLTLPCLSSSSEEKPTSSQPPPDRLPTPTSSR